MRKTLTLLSIFIFISFAYAYSETLDIQGVLRNATSGAALNGTYVFNITFFNGTGTTPVYSEQVSLASSSGIWNYIVGDTVSINSELFKSNMTYRIKVGDDLLDVENFSKAPYCWNADFARDAGLFGGNVPSAYQDVVTTDGIRGNFSGSANISYDSTNGIFAINISILTEDAVTGQNFRNGTQINDSIEVYLQDYSLTSIIASWFATNRTLTDNQFASLVNDTGITGQDLYNGTQVNASIDAKIVNYALGDSLVGNFTINNGSNITIINGELALNLTCEQITGSADLCDGDDNAGAGTYDWNYTGDQGGYGVITDSEIFNITGNGSAVTYVETNRIVLECTDTNTFNSSADIKREIIGDGSFWTLTNETAALLPYAIGASLPNISVSDGALYTPVNFTADHTLASHNGIGVWNTGNFTAADIINWNAAFGWGDHSTEGYLKNVNNVSQAYIDGINDTANINNLFTDDLTTDDNTNMSVGGTFTADINISTQDIHNSYGGNFSGNSTCAFIFRNTVSGTEFAIC